VTEPTLRRSVSLPLLTLYGLGTIVGAGIYVLIAAVASQAGGAMPFAFLLAAVIAGFTAFSYAELGARFPFSAGEAVYIDNAFSMRLATLLIGYAVVFVGISSAATISRSFCGYLSVFIDMPDTVVISVLVLSLGTIAAIGIGISVWFATIITLISLIGLFIVLGVAWDPGILIAEPHRLAVGDHGYVGVMAGALLTFYAFIGFEDMVNIAEEVESPERNLPIAIVVALVASTLLYLLVALAAVSSLPLHELQQSRAPLADIIAAHGYDPTLITGISLISVINGALVQVIMAARVLFGMSARGVAHRWLGLISPLTRTPVNATVIVVILVLVAALTLPLVKLAAITSTVTLLIFAAVNAALLRLRLTAGPAVGSVNYPLIIPALGCLLSLVLLLFSYGIST